MSLESERDTAGDERVYRLLGVAVAVGFPIAFGGVGWAALDSLVYGVAAGLLTGVGGYLFLPWFVRLSASAEGGDDQPSLVELIADAPGDPGVRFLGFGLDAGGIVVLAVGFATDEPNLLLGVGSGVVFALAVYLVASVAFAQFDSTAA
ncbi:hypothetical protein RYH80_04835 [Halobaculum sp. MBLA0147]|uniref:hypothetical protein n=1 Tax=Halobaculum sp. MBLA0147 TaxID=3079934 RepID=UPI003525E997